MLKKREEAQCCGTVPCLSAPYCSSEKFGDFSFCLMWAHEEPLHSYTMSVVCSLRSCFDWIVFRKEIFIFHLQRAISSYFQKAAVCNSRSLCWMICVWTTAFHLLIMLSHGGMIPRKFLMCIMLCFPILPRDLYGAMYVFNLSLKSLKRLTSPDSGTEFWWAQNCCLK